MQICNDMEFGDEKCNKWRDLMRQMKRFARQIEGFWRALRCNFDAVKICLLAQTPQLRCGHRKALQKPAKCHSSAILQLAQLSQSAKMAQDLPQSPPRHLNIHHLTVSHIRPPHNSCHCLATQLYA